MSLLRAGLLIALAALLGGVLGYFLGGLIGKPILGLIIGGSLFGYLVYLTIARGLDR